MPTAAVRTRSSPEPQRSVAAEEISDRDGGIVCHVGCSRNFSRTYLWQPSIVVRWFRIMAVQGIVKGYSAREDLCELVGFFWKLALDVKVNLYIDRISTGANPGDPPSRDPTDVGIKLGWRTVESKFPIYQLGRKSFVLTVQGSCVVRLLLFLFGSMNRSPNTFGRDVWSFFWSILINFNKIKHDPLLTHVLRGTKRACSSVAAKITLLPNNSNWFTNLRSGRVGVRGSIFQLCS